MLGLVDRDLHLQDIVLLSCRIFVDSVSFHAFVALDTARMVHTIDTQDWEQSSTRPFATRCCPDRLILRGLEAGTLIFQQQHLL